jgi:hypothetical protein
LEHLDGFAMVIVSPKEFGVLNRSCIVAQLRRMQNSVE